jgi:hypothetical protein
MAVSKRFAPLLTIPLQKYEINIYSPEPEPNIDQRIADHPDLQLCHVADARIVATENTSAQLKRIGFTVIGDQVSVAEDYSNHVGLNASIIKTNVFHNFKTTSYALLKQIENEKMKKLFVRQGYTKCSICIINSNAIITEDAGIHKVAQNAGLCSLLISKGYVTLSGFPYGFIGGASGLIAQGKIAFTGILNHHPQYNDILNFLRENKAEPIFLTDNQIFDCGSLLPLKEYCREI